jgi:hypothetical protein
MDDIGSNGLDTDVLFGQCILDTEKDSRILLFFGRFPITEGKTKGKDLNLRFFNIVGEAIRGALRVDPALGAEVALCYMVKPIEDAPSYRINDILNTD